MLFEVCAVFTLERVQRVEREILGELFVSTHLIVRGAPSLSLRLLEGQGGDFDFAPSTLKRFPQRNQSTANSGLDRPQRLARLVRDFRMAHAFEVCHLERAALGSRDRAQHAAYFFRSPRPDRKSVV